MTFEPARVVSAGAVCAIGGGLEQIDASVRTGYSAMAASSIHDRFFEPIKMALVPENALGPLTEAADALPLTSRQRRMLRLATPALQQALEGIEDLQRVPLFLGLPEAHPKRPAPVDEKFLQYMQVQTGLAFDAASSRCFANGRAAGLLALDAAVRHISERRSELAIVGGVDSYLDLALLAELDAEQRLLGQRVMDGFVPGEGAAFVVLGSYYLQRPHGVRTPLVLAAGKALDPGHRYGQQPAKGEGLSEAIEAMIASLGAEPNPVRTTFASLNGESFGAKEWGDIVHPADCAGDTGAAAGALLLALAQRMLAHETKPGPMLIWATSDGEDCACAYLDW
jgi:3-oxoacyl-[acyl-carrier-protein] synthase-1